MSVRAQGEGFFARVDTRFYLPQGIVIGQVHRDSCVAACCRMLLHDEGRVVGETVIRALLTSDDRGALLSSAPQTLQQLGSTVGYAYRTNLTVADLRASVLKGPAIVFLKENLHQPFGHTVMVDGFEQDWVLIRDPWPISDGSAYGVAVANFESVWLVKGGLTGRAVLR